MFVGEFQHTLDPKGRLILPAKFREALSDGLVMTKGFENCIFIFSRAEWPKVEDKLRSLALLKKQARMLSRFFFSGTSEEVPDRQGRVLVPQNLREHAELEKEIVVIGVANRLEVWSKANWERYSSEAKGSYEETAEELADIDL